MTAVLLLAWGCKPGPETGTVDTAPAPVAGPYTSAEGLFDAQGRQLLLRGANLPTLEYVDADFDILAGWGVDVVRQLYFWSELEPVQGTYEEGYVDQIARQVELARDHGMRVVIDHHQHCYGGCLGWGMPGWACAATADGACEDPWNYFGHEVQGCFATFWTDPDLQAAYIAQLVHVAQRFVHEPAVIGYDVINEPFCLSADGLDCGQAMSDFYAAAAAALQQVSPDTFIFWEPSYLELVGVETAVVPTFKNGVYAPHYYLMEVHDGGDYDLDSTQIRLAVELRAREAAAFDQPLFMGEFGGMASVANFDRYIDDHMDLFDQYEASATYWLYERGDGFHMLDSEGQEKPFLDQFVRPYARATPGRVLSTGFDDATGRFSLEIEGDPTLGAEGEIFVPERHYPEGGQLRGCEAPGCTWELEEGVVRYRIWEEGRYVLEM